MPTRNITPCLIMFFVFALPGASLVSEAGENDESQIGYKSGYGDLEEFGGPASTAAELKVADAIKTPLFRMPKIEDFFTAQEEQQVVDAIKIAETNTSGEIRVHIEKSTDKDVLERAKEVFYQLKMNETQLQNGVLFYIATESHHFAVLGDKGINEF